MAASPAGGTTVRDLLCLIDALLAAGEVTASTPVTVSEDEPLAARLDPAAHRPRRLDGYGLHPAAGGVQLVLLTA